MNGTLIIIVAPPGEYGYGRTLVDVFEAAGWECFGEFLNWPDLQRTQEKLRSGVNIACGTTPHRLEGLGSEVKALQREFEVVILDLRSWSRSYIIVAGGLA